MLLRSGTEREKGTGLHCAQAQRSTLSSITNSVIVTAQSHSDSHHSQTEQLSWRPGDGQSDDISGLNISKSAFAVSERTAVTSRQSHHRLAEWGGDADEP